MMTELALRETNEQRFSSKSLRKMSDSSLICIIDNIYKRIAPHTEYAQLITHANKKSNEKPHTSLKLSKYH